MITQEKKVPVFTHQLLVFEYMKWKFSLTVWDVAALDRKVTHCHADCHCHSHFPLVKGKQKALYPSEGPGRADTPICELGLWSRA